MSFRGKQTEDCKRSRRAYHMRSGLHHLFRGGMAQKEKTEMTTTPPSKLELVVLTFIIVLSASAVSRAFPFPVLPEPKCCTPGFYSEPNSGCVVDCALQASCNAPIHSGYWNVGTCTPRTDYSCTLGMAWHNIRYYECKKYACEFGDPPATGEKCLWAPHSISIYTEPGMDCSGSGPTPNCPE